MMTAVISVIDSEIKVSWQIIHHQYIQSSKTESRFWSRKGGGHTLSIGLNRWGEMLIGLNLLDEEDEEDPTSFIAMKEDFWWKGPIYYLLSQAGRYW